MCDIELEDDYKNIEPNDDRPSGNLLFFSVEKFFSFQKVFLTLHYFQKLLMMILMEN